MGFYNHWVIFVHNLKNVFRFILDHIKVFWLLFIPLFIIILVSNNSEVHATTEPTLTEWYTAKEMALDYVHDNINNGSSYNKYIAFYTGTQMCFFVLRDDATCYIKTFYNQGVTTRRIWCNYNVMVWFKDLNTSPSNAVVIDGVIGDGQSSAVNAYEETKYIKYNNFDIHYYNSSVEIANNPITYNPNFTISEQADLDLASYNTPFFLNGYSGEYKTYDLCTLYIGYCPSSSYNQDNPVWQTKAFLLNSESPYLQYVSALDYTYSFNIPSRDLLPGVVVNNSDYIRVWVVKPNANTNGDVLFDKVWHISGRTQEQIELDEKNQTNEQLTELTQGVNDLNQNITSVNDTLNNSTVDESNVGTITSLGFTVNDNTGLDGAFNILYNAFCNDSVKAFTVTIPFVNETFTIDTNTFDFPEPLRNIISIMVWGMISLWVIKDIRSMINKMSEGSPEDVGSDVKKEVL